MLRSGSDVTPDECSVKSAAIGEYAVDDGHGKGTEGTPAHSTVEFRHLAPAAEAGSVAG